MHPYSCIETATARKKFRFILSDRSDFRMIDSLSVAVNAITRCISKSLSVDETLPQRYVNMSTNSRGRSLRLEMVFSRLKYTYSIFICVHGEPNAACCLLQATQQGFGWSRYICKKVIPRHSLLGCLRRQAIDSALPS